ncbi:precorrin-2/cobalt-factor-2 C20-methyltransferase [Paracoccus solventivorans]|uniref:Precorrin-2/cobalt-factor-2 C20-methyltransferase n=1 Tax=Paracoccus solventivorans TaxID=53463 RepID=A0A1M7H173_9RHOB|nr:precorrin-2 C(20)-methyltransferase [Paracoccus solventivorans]SHM21877.1 precorrin-2/cobalt-factor-2 C20-methyltransferase [Paracoccus solventivorans]
MARIICAGLGPGDPDLMSVRADRALRGARRIAYFRKPGRPGMARRIVQGLLAPGCVELAMEYPVTTEIPLSDPAYNAQLAAFYDHWAERLAALPGEVVVLCEGDPFFYGSFMHLHLRLQGRCEIEVIPGITGMSGCWTATDMPIAWGDDVLTVLMGTLDEDALAARMAGTDALVVMKTGRNLPKLRRALSRAGRLDAAWLVERGTMQGQRVQRLVESDAEVAPYFAILLVHGQGRRPLALPRAAE